MRFLIPAKFVVAIIGFHIAQISYSQEPEEIVEKVNKAIEQHNHWHFKTSYTSKYYAREDTSFTKAETWVYKTAKDTVLGMHIRSISESKHGNWETFHYGTETWLINYQTDTITLYDQSKGHWDGFSGNTKSSWTTEMPLTEGIIYDPEDSLVVDFLDNGDWKITRHIPDAVDYGIYDIYISSWIDKNSMLPYRTVERWKLGERETFNLLEIEILSHDVEDLERGLDKTLPDFPIIDYVEPDPDQFKPHKIGTPAPEMLGHFLKDSSSFDLNNYLDGHLVMLDFWYQTCAPCIQAIPYLDSLNEEFKDQGFVLFEVNSNDFNVEREKLIKFLDSRGGDLDHIVMTQRSTERDLWKSYANPTFYLIKNGEIVWVQQGFGPQLMKEFRTKIAEYLE